MSSDITRLMRSLSSGGESVITKPSKVIPDEMIPIPSRKPEQAEASGDLTMVIPSRKPKQSEDFGRTVMKQLGGTPEYSSVKGLSNALTQYGISDLDQQAGILAQLKAESNFVPRDENLNYSAKRLMEVFPKYFKDKKDAINVASRGKEAIGNRIYGGRMGNDENEGYKYRGRGFIQLTGKDNYRRYGDKIGLDLEKKPDLVNDPEVALKIAVEYLKDRSKDLRDPYENTKAVAPVGWRSKVTPRGDHQNEIRLLLEELGVS